MVLAFHFTFSIGGSSGWRLGAQFAIFQLTTEIGSLPASIPVNFSESDVVIVDLCEGRRIAFRDDSYMDVFVGILSHTCAVPTVVTARSATVLGRGKATQTRAE